MKGFCKIYRLLFILIGLTSVSGQVPRPNATPYNNEVVYDKLVKKYPYIKPINKPIPQNIKVDKDVEYANLNGLSLKADVYYPTDHSEKNPGVVLIHGGGWISGSKENEQFMAQELAARGYVAMAVGYRLADVAKYPAAIEDVEKAIKFLKKSHKKYNLDQSKLAILGESAGGQIATLVGVKSKHIKAIVNIDGIVSFTHHESEEGTYAAYWLNGDKNCNPENWTKASPLEYVNKHSPSTIFINSSQPRFHAGRDSMMKKLKDYNIATEFYEIKDSPHSFWCVEPWFTETFELVIRFLNKTLN